MVVAYLIAAALAVGLGVLELASQLNSRPTLREWAWFSWLVRMLFDAGAGVFATWLLIELTDEEWPTVVIGVVAGLSASTLLRQQFLTIGQQPIGFDPIYGLIRGFFDSEIDRRGSEHDSKWVHETVIPTLIRAGISPEEVAKRLAASVARRSLLSAMEDSQRLDVQKTIQDINSENIDDRTKIEARIDLGLDVKAFRTIRNLCKHAEGLLRQRAAERQPDRS